MEIVSRDEMHSVGSLWQEIVDLLGELKDDDCLKISEEEIIKNGYKHISGFRASLHLQFPRKFVTRLSDQKKSSENLMYIALKKHYD